LAGVTSLPEVATSFTAAGIGDAPLAINNLLGSVVMQVALLALADFIFSRHALTAIVPDPIVILQGALNVCLLATVAVAALAPEVAFLGAGAWTWGLLAASLLSFYKLVESGGRQPWIASNKTDLSEQSGAREMPEGSAAKLIAQIAGIGVVILTAGAIVALSGQAIAEQSGLGSSFFGYVFVAISTSLPEASTVYATMRRRLYTMAISDILGTNILNVSLLFFVDLISPGEPVMRAAGPFAAVAAMLGVAVTGLFVMGLAERRDRAFLRLGLDSALVILVYAGGLALLYGLRPSG
jgi:cation:H+ antiporter